MTVEQAELDAMRAQTVVANALHPIAARKLLDAYEELRTLAGELAEALVKVERHSDRCFREDDEGSMVLKPRCALGCEWGHSGANASLAKVRDAGLLEPA